MEEELDEIARGERPWVRAIQDFYTPFEQMLNRASVEMVKVKEPDQPTDEVCVKCGKPMVIRAGRYGKFLACTGYPKCKTTKALAAKREQPRESPGEAGAQIEQERPPKDEA
jgi:DNA topoisomerase-1